MSEEETVPGPSPRNAQLAAEDQLSNARGSAVPHECRDLFRVEEFHLAPARCNVSASRRRPCVVRNMAENNLKIAYMEGLGLEREPQLNNFSTVVLQRERATAFTKQLVDVDLVAVDHSPWGHVAVGIAIANKLPVIMVGAVEKAASLAAHHPSISLVDTVSDAVVQIRRLAKRIQAVRVLYEDFAEDLVAGAS